MRPLRSAGRHVAGRRPATLHEQVVRWGRPAVRRQHDGTFRVVQQGVTRQGQVVHAVSGPRETQTQAIRLGWFWAMFREEQTS